MADHLEKCIKCPFYFSFSSKEIMCEDIYGKTRREFTSPGQRKEYMRKNCYQRYPGCRQYLKMMRKYEEDGK